MTEKVDWSSFEVVDAPSPAAASTPQSGTVDWSSFEVVGLEEKPKTSILRRAGDVGIAALKGAIGVPETAVGLADIATGGRAGKLAEEAGFRPKEAKAILSEYLSPKQQAANKAVSEAKGFTETAKAAFQNPSVIGQQVIESLPSMGAGGLIGRGLAAGTKIAPWVAGAIGEGIVGGGQAAEQTRQQMESGLITPKQAAAAVASGAGTAAFGMAGGRIAHRLGIADVDTMLAGGGSALTSKGVAKRIIEGGISEGAFEELPQSIQEQIWQNVAMDKPLLEGVPESAAMGLITGAAMGGAAGGAFHGHPTVADISKAQSVDEAIATATTSVESQPAPAAAAATIAELERTAGMATPEPAIPTAPASITQPEIAAPELVNIPAAAPSITAQPENAAELTAIQLAMQQAVSQREARQREADDLAAIQQDIELNRTNKTRADRMAMLDSILANDEIVGIKSKLARFAGDLQRAGYTNPTINPEEWTHARRYSNAAIGLSEMDVVPVAPAVRVAPNEMPPELVREKTAAVLPTAAAVAPLPAEYHDLARASKNVEQFWKGLNAMKVPMKGRSPLTAAYKAFKKSETANVAPTPAAAVPVRNVSATSAIQAAPERGNIERVGAPTVQPLSERLQNTGAIQPAAGVSVPGANEGVQQPVAINKRQEAIASLESLTGKELRNIATKDKRAYMRNAAADILQTRSQETRQKRSELAKKIYVKSKQIDPDRDTMAQAIAKLGGINSESAAGRLRLAPEELNIRGHGVLRVFNKAGRSMDEVGAQLADLGYVQHDANGKYDQTDFEDKLAEVAGGNEILTPNGMMQRAQENHDQAMAEVGATSPEEYKSIENYADNATDDIQNAIDAAFDSPISQKELSDDEIDSLFGIEKESSGIHEVATQGQARPSGEGNQAPAAENFLQSESEAEANARLAAAKEKTRLADLELKRLDEVEKHAKIQKEIDRRQAASAENFQLGQTAEDAISGQEPLFSKAQKNDLNEMRDLIVTHNITAKNLMHAAKMGGLAVPSLAVTKKDTPLSGFGEITLIGSRELIDPKGYAKTQVFGADIYSPRYPSVEYHIPAMELKAAKSKMAAAEKATGFEMDWDEVRRNGVRELENSAPMMWNFLSAQGITPEIVYEKGVDQVRVDRLRAQGFGEYLTRTDKYNMTEDPAFVKLAVDARIADYVEAGKGDRFKSTIAELQTDDDLRYRTARDMAHEIAAIAEKSSRPPLPDKYATRNRLNEQVREASLTNEFDRYAQNFLGSLNADEKIFKGYSSSGNKTYTPHTLDNVVKILKKELRGGENFNYGVGSLRAKFTPQFKTIADIRKAKDRLISKEDFEKIKNEIDEEFLSVGRAMGANLNMDTVVAILEDAPKMGLEKAAAQFKIELTPEANQKAVEFLERLRHLPTEYFEAKVLRDVDLSEFSGAVIPNNTPQNVRDELAKSGVPIKEYADETDRAQAILGFANELDQEKKNILFSQGQRVSGITKAWQALAQSDAIFKYPKSDSKDILEIFQIAAPRIAIEPTTRGMPDDMDKAWNIYPIDSKGNADKTRNGWVLQYKDGRVEINVANFATGDLGSQVYAAVGNYAYNNDLLFSGDRFGVSEDAMYRRLENLTSLALKFGSTDFIALHPDQIDRFGIDWKDGDTTHNIGEMLEASFNHVAETTPEIKEIIYDFDTSEFKDISSGLEYDERGIERISEGARARGFRGGSATFKRAVLTNTFLQGSTGAIQRSLLQKISEFGGKPLDEALVGLAYSRSQRVSGITADEVAKATARLRAKWIGFTKVNTVQSVNDLPTDILDRVKPDAQTEGFYDPQTQSVYLIADNIASPERSVWIITHEIVGHGGLRMLKDKSVDDAVKLAGMNRFVRELSAAIAKDRGGLAQNIATEEAIAELAAATETNDFQSLTDRYDVDVPTSAQNGIRGTIARVLDAVKRFLASVMGKPVAEVSDADVRSLIAAQREAVESAAPNQREPIGSAAMASTKADQTSTSAFRKWFGNSKVVDADGNPMVVYHGSRSDFDQFIGNRFYFTADPSYASAYADGGNVMPVYLALKNPLDLTSLGSGILSEQSVLNALSVNGVDISDLRGRVRSKDDGDIGVWAWWHNAAVRKAVQIAGFDSAIQREDTGAGQTVAYIAFKPEQIKSATGNIGTFDVTNPDIRFSKASLGNLNAAQEAAAENILGKPKTIGQRMQEFKQQWQKNLVQGVFDQFAPIKELSEKAYIQSRMSRGGDSTLEALMMYGKVVVDQDGFYASTYQKAKGKEGFAQAMAKLKGEHDRFFLWVAAHRAESLASVGLENLFKASDIAALKTLSQGQMKDGAPRTALYLQAMKDLNDFNDSVLKIAEDSGLIDAAARAMYKDMPYIPFYRLQEEGIAGFGMKAGLINQSAWKKLKGGTEKLNEDLMANLLQNWSHLITASAKNRAAKASLDAAVNAGVATQVPSGAPGKGTVSYREAGKDKTFLVSDPHVMDAISALEYAGLGPWAKPLTTMKRMLTIGVTANPAFKIRNLIRDSVQAIGTADLSYNPLSNISSGWMATADDSEIRAQMLASGGMIRFGSMLEGNSSQRAKDLINHDIDPAMVLDDDNKVKAFWKGNIQPAIDAYQELGDRGEQVNRAALYQRLLDKGMSHGEASFWARDLMDFSSTGKWQAVRFLTQVVPFMNARLQGLYKLGRAGKQDMKRMGYVTGVVALASIALMAAYKDDDDWKKREDWDRQNYWWFKIGDTAFRIPKPFELGSIGTIAEMGVEYFSSDEMTGRRFVENIGAIVGSQLSMNPIPQLVKPMLDVYANKDSFTKRPIESLAMQRLKPSERYNERTSEVGRFLGSLGLPDPAMLMMGHYEELSPVKIDALTRGYFSWLGVMATTAIDYGIRPMMDRGERPAMQLKDAFVVGNFAESLPTNSSRYVSQMYDQANAIEQAYATYQQAIKQGDIEKAKSLLAENRKEIMAHKNIAAIKRRESEINAQINKITSSKTMGADEKRRLIDVLSAKRDQVARMIMR